MLRGYLKNIEQRLMRLKAKSGTDEVLKLLESFDKNVQELLKQGDHSQTGIIPHVTGRLTRNTHINVPRVLRQYATALEQQPGESSSTSRPMKRYSHRVFKRFSLGKKKKVKNNGKESTGGGKKEETNKKTQKKHVANPTLTSFSRK